MIVDEIRAWSGGTVPEPYKGTGPFEITIEMLDELSKIFDVAIMHHRTQQPTRAERARGVHPAPDRCVIWLDVYGGKFARR